MPKRKRSTATSLDSLPSPDNPSDNGLANNFSDRTGDVDHAKADSERDGTRTLARRSSEGESTPFGSLLASVQAKAEAQFELERASQALAISERRYSASALEQWNGLTPEVEQVIIAAVRLGRSRAVAMKLVGYSTHRLANWLAMGSQGLSPFANFRREFLRAEAVAEMETTSRVEQAAVSELKTAAVFLKLLERRHPSKETDDDSVGDDLPFDRFTTEELDAYLASGGKTVPARFLRGGPAVDALPVEDSEVAARIHRLEEENRILLLRLEESKAHEIQE